MYFSDPSSCETGRIFLHIFSNLSDKYLHMSDIIATFVAYKYNINFKISVMNSNLQKSVEESLERLLRSLLSSEYFDKLSCDDRVNIIMSLFDYLLKNCK